MVDSIKSSSQSLPVVNSTYKAASMTTAVAPIGDKEQTQPHAKKVDRRSGKGRRRSHSSKHPKFEMRQSPGRRKEDRDGPTIETLA